MNIRGHPIREDWSCDCRVLRTPSHSGVSTLDYVEQLTYLLFLKMADERANRRLNPERIIPDALGWRIPSTRRLITCMIDMISFWLSWVKAGDAGGDFQWGEKQDSGARDYGAAR